jgi:chitinase
LIIGLATYGRHFQLANTNNYQPGDAAVGSGGTAGPYTREKGFLAYYEVTCFISLL